MWRSATLAIVLLASWTATAAAPPLAPAPGPAPAPRLAIPTPPFALRPDTAPRVVVFQAQGLTCGGGEPSALGALDIAPQPVSIITAYAPAVVSGADVVSPSPPPAVDPVFDFGFNVSADGRMLDIAAIPAPPASFTPHQPYVGDQEVQPGLAAWRFAPGRPATGCRVHVVGRVLSYDLAGRSNLARAFALNPTLTTGLKEIRAALEPGADCYSGERLYPRVQHFVAVDEMHEAPGERSWAVVRFDVATDGRTRDVRVVASSGRADLDLAAVRAQSQSTYAPHAKRGCLFRYYDRAGLLPTPPEPPAANTDEGGCPANPKITLGDLSNLFPPAFLRRRIEGYALVSYDVAPWGQIGQVKVVKSEPAAAFGQAARSMVLSGRVAPSERGYQGCLKPVRFKLRDDQAPDQAASEP